MRVNCRLVTNQENIRLLGPLLSLDQVYRDRIVLK